MSSIGRGIGIRRRRRTYAEYQVDQAVNLLIAASDARATARLVWSLPSDGVVADGMSLLQIGAGELAVNGGRYATTVADGAELGPELATGSDWSQDSYPGIEYDGETATFTAADSGQFLYKNVGITAGKRYQIKFTIESLTAGSIRAFYGGGVAVYTPINSALKNYTHELVAQIGTNGNFSLVPYEVLTATVTNISCREIIPTWISFTIESPWKNSVAIGDSITADVTDGWVTQINVIAGNVTMANTGVGGNTIQQMDARFAADVVALNPDIVCIFGGINNIGPAVTSPLTTLRSSFESMVGKAEAASIDVVIIGLSPFGSATSPWTWTLERQGWLEEYNTYLANYVTTNGYRFVDTYTPLVGSDGYTMADGLTTDYLHPINAGYTIIAEAVAAIATESSTAALTPTVGVAKQSVNKCEVVKANPTDTTGLTYAASGASSGSVSIANKTAELAAVGLGLTCTSGNVYHLNAVGGRGVSHIDGVTANTNKHSGFIYAMGVGSIHLNGDWASGRVDFNSPSSFVVVELPDKTPADGARFLDVSSDPAGSDVYFILPGLYENSAVPGNAPVIGDDLASAATTDADVVSFPTPSVLTGANWARKGFATPAATGQTEVLWSSYTDANNYVALQSTPAQLILRKRVAGTNYDATFTYTHLADTLFEWRAYGGPSGTGLVVATTAVTSESFQTNVNTLDTPWAATIDLGNLNDVVGFMAEYDDIDYNWVSYEAADTRNWE